MKVPEQVETMKTNKDAQFNGNYKFNLTVDIVYCGG